MDANRTAETKRLLRTVKKWWSEVNVLIITGATTAKLATRAGCAQQGLEHDLSPIHVDVSGHRIQRLPLSSPVPNTGPFLCPTS